MADQFWFETHCPLCGDMGSLGPFYGFELIDEVENEKKATLQKCRDPSCKGICVYTVNTQTTG
jgi:hypothetical protein